MRLFGGDQVAKLMTAFNLPEDVPLEHPMVSRAIEQAQVKVEGFHFDSRKHLVEYDDVLSKQREIVYRRRRKILEGEKLRDKMIESVSEEVSMIVAAYATENDSMFDRQKIVTVFCSIIPFDENSQQQLVTQLEQLHTSADITEFLQNLSRDMYEGREKQMTPDVSAQIERWVSLNVIDNLWMDH
jgi:preprotein translocase subunit SecA